MIANGYPRLLPTASVAWVNQFMSQLPPEIEIRLHGKDSFSVAMMVIEDLCGEIGGLRGKIGSLYGEIAGLKAQNERLLKENAKLQAKLGRPAKTPENSSLPPSAHPKPNGAMKCEPEAAAPKRPAHPGAHRPLCENPTRVMDLREQRKRFCLVWQGW